MFWNVLQSWNLISPCCSLDCVSSSVCRSTFAGFLVVFHLALGSEAAIAFCTFKRIWVYVTLVHSLYMDARPHAFRHCFWQHLHVRDFSCFVSFLFVFIVCSGFPLLFPHRSRNDIRFLIIFLHSVLFSVRRSRSDGSIPASVISRRQYCGVFLQLFLCLSTVAGSIPVLLVWLGDHR